MTEAANLATTNNSETVQAWNQYNFIQQQGADTTDGSEVGYAPSYGMSYFVHIRCTYCNYVS